MVTGIAYGRTTGALKDWNSLPKMLAGSINSMVNFMVIALPASLFIYLFNASNIPTALGAAGAEWMKNIRYQWIWPYCIYCIFLYIFKLF